MTLVLTRARHFAAHALTAGLGREPKRLPADGTRPPPVDAELDCDRRGLSNAGSAALGLGDMSDDDFAASQRRAREHMLREQREREERAAKRRKLTGSSRLW